MPAGFACGPRTGVPSVPHSCPAGLAALGLACEGGIVSVPPIYRCKSRGREQLREPCLCEMLPSFRGAQEGNQRRAGQSQAFSNKYWSNT